jgi:hypothetical protein
MLFNELGCVEIVVEMCSILILAVSQWDGDADPSAVVVLGIYLDFKIIVIVVLLLENNMVYFVGY